jgi:hypothetical protein
MRTIRIVSHVFLYIYTINIPSFDCELPMYFYMLKCLGPFSYAALVVPLAMGEIDVVLNSVRTK